MKTSKHSQSTTLSQDSRRLVTEPTEEGTCHCPCPSVQTNETHITRSNFIDADRITIKMLQNTGDRLMRGSPKDTIRHLNRNIFRSKLQHRHRLEERKKYESSVKTQGGHLQDLFYLNLSKPVQRKKPQVSLGSSQAIGQEQSNIIRLKKEMKSCERRRKDLQDELKIADKRQSVDKVVKILFKPILSYEFMKLSRKDILLPLKSNTFLVKHQSRVSKILSKNSVCY